MLHLSLADTVVRGLAAEGFVVEVATIGVGGLWMAQEFAYDIIILDIMLSRHERLRDLSSTTRGWFLGADDYLSKPFSFVVLLARLRALLRHAF